ncbi:Aste57867_15600 [Aphanomyces stellatus]|uniref:Aste57867_15600 protein n=1 Tax=Aphanomyces stellatus TaxID=120398 RepID=A0A485L3H2_9STRA|nr:hypothetical protein As57867_015544 [Aphanomyces stellatus]VFT92402.1 Aste57867_15600 [Aphanomyces stellatus]
MPEAATDGLTIGFITHFINVHGGKDAFQGLTTREVCWKYVVPYTAAMELSQVDHVRDHDSNGRTYVKPAAWFVSHAWDYAFLDVVDALDTFLSECQVEDLDRVAVWFCVFNNNQHEFSYGSHPFEYWFGRFHDALTSIANVVMVFSPWNHPTTHAHVVCV